MSSKSIPAGYANTSAVRELRAGEVRLVPHRHQALTSPEQLIQSLALELSNHLSVIAAQVTLQEKAGDARSGGQAARIAQAASRGAQITRTILALTAQASLPSREQTQH